MRGASGEANRVVLARPWREVALEVLSLSTFAVVVAWLTISAPVGFNWEASVEPMRIAGKEVLAQLGWGLGIYIPTLLGFYAIVGGGQLLGGEAAAARVRRVLGFAAELMCAAIIPAVAFLIVYVTVTPAKLGALLVVLPVTGLMIFLVVQLGGFLVPDPAVWLQSVESSRAAWRVKLKSLSRRSQRPAIAVLIVNAVLPTIIGILLVLPLTGWDEALWVVGAAFALPVSILVGIGWAAELMRVQLGGPIGALSGMVFPVILWLVAAVMLSIQFAVSLPWVIVAVMLPLSFCLISTIGVGNRAPDWFVNWSVRGVSRRSAARSVVRSLRRSSVQLRELRKQLAEPPPFSGRNRIRAWLYRLVSLPDRDAV